MHVADYLDHVEITDRNKAVMARIVLNTLGDAKRFPVDISQLRLLSPTNRALTTAFQEWAFSHRHWKFDDFTLEALQEMANSATTS